MDPHSLLPNIAGLDKGKGKIRLPNIQVVVQMPAPLIDSVQGKKVHNTATIKALKDVLMRYWRGRWQDHYRQDARAKYGYRDRAPGYKKKKMKVMHGAIDLIWKGNTKTYTTHAVPQFKIASGDFGGYKRKGQTTSSAFGVTGVLETKFGFPATASMDIGTRKDGSPKITPSEMADELGRWSSDSVIWAADAYKTKYVELLTAAIMAAPRWRKKYEAAVKNYNP